MASTQVKRLYRSKTDRVLGGVCGGIGEYFNTDPTLIRLLWVVFTLAWGAGILAYIIAWVIVPEKPVEAPPAAQPPTAPPTPPAPPLPTAKVGVVLGVIIVVLGVILFLFTLEIIPWNFWWTWLSWRRVVGLFWPLLFILVGVLLIAIGIKGR